LSQACVTHGYHAPSAVIVAICLSAKD
jgi:hypothetical protein